MVSGRTCSITSNLQMEVESEHALKEHEDSSKSVVAGQDGNAIADPNKSGNGSSEGGHDDAPGLMKSMSEILVHSAQSVKDFVSGNGSNSSEGGESEERGLFQAMGEKIAQSVESVKDAVNSGLDNEDGEERTLLQSVSERIVQSARNVKDGVNGNGDHLLTDADETGESTILVHAVLD